MTREMEFHMVPMKRDGDTIFEEPVFEKEDFGVVSDFNVWVKDRVNTWKEHRATCLYEIVERVDEEAAQYVSPHFKGFMTQPVALVEGRVLTAKTRIVASFNDLMRLKELLEREDPKGDRYLLDLLYSPPKFTRRDVDRVSFQPILLGEPRMTDGYWKIRYAVDVNE